MRHRRHDGTAARPGTSGRTSVSPYSHRLRRGSPAWRNLGASLVHINLITGSTRIIRSLCQTRDGSLIFKDVKQKKSRRVLTLPAFVLDGLRDAQGEQNRNRQFFGKDYRLTTWSAACRMAAPFHRIP